MDMDSEDLVVMMNTFLEEAKHKTYFGVFKYEEELMDGKFTLKADSFTGEVKAIFKNYTIVYNSNTRVANQIVTSPTISLSGSDNVTYNMQNETEKLTNSMLHAKLLGLSYDLRSKSTDDIWKIFLKRSVRKFFGVFVDETSRGLIGVILGILIFWMGAMAYQWMFVDHRIQEIKYIPIENLCINAVNCSQQTIPEAGFKGRSFTFPRH